MKTINIILAANAFLVAILILMGASAVGTGEKQLQTIETYEKIMKKLAEENMELYGKANKCIRSNNFNGHTA
jgi:cell division protein FtsB